MRDKVIPTVPPSFFFVMYTDAMHPLLRDTAGFFILLIFAFLVALVIGLGTGEPAQFLGAVNQPGQNVQNIQRTACVLRALPSPPVSPLGSVTGIWDPNLSRPTAGSSEYFVTSRAQYFLNYPPRYTIVNDMYGMGNGIVGPGNRGWLPTINGANTQNQNAAAYGGAIAYLRFNQSRSLMELMTQYAGQDRLLQTADDNYYLTAEDIRGAFHLGGPIFGDPGGTALSATGITYMATLSQSIPRVVIDQGFGQDGIPGWPFRGGDDVLGFVDIHRQGQPGSGTVVGVARGHNKVVLLNEQQQNGEQWVVLEDPGPDGLFSGGPAAGDREQVFGGGVSYLSGRLSPTGRFAASILSYGGQQVNANVYDLGRGGDVTQGRTIALTLPQLPPAPPPQGTSTPLILHWIDTDEEGAGSGEVAVLGESSTADGTPSGSPYWFIVHYRVGPDDRFGSADDIVTLTMFPKASGDSINGLSLRGGVVVLSGSVVAATPAAPLSSKFYSCRLP